MGLDKERAICYTMGMRKTTDAVATHTPGPIEFKRRVDGKWVTKAKHDTDPDSDVVLVAVYERGEGDARLGSAAPDLLAAANALLPYFQIIGHPQWEALRAAISKAQGAA